MALGALIGAYQEDDSGGLRALLPLAGRTLLEYQVRCVAAAGASPIIVLVERIPIALNQAFERLRSEGLNVVPVSDGNEAAGRFEPGMPILLVGDGIAPPVDLLIQLSEEPEPAIVTVPDDTAHADFERIDDVSRWAGVALVDGRTLGATAAMLGDWDLQSTLLRRTLQAGALPVPLSEGVPGPMLAANAAMLADFERDLVVGSRTARNDFASRHIFPIVEEIATEKLMESRIKPGILVVAAAALTFFAAFGFTRGWLWAGLASLVIASPLDLIARRLATLRLQPLSSKMVARRLLWPASGLALLALGWWIARHGGGWGAFVTAGTAAAFAQAARNEQPINPPPLRIWLFSRRNAIIAAIPFAIANSWIAYLIFLMLYAAASFFLLQHLRHRVGID